MSARAEGLSHSIQVRLATHAKAIGVDSNLVLTRYGIERFLCRLSRSPYSDRFVPKGAPERLIAVVDDIVAFAAPVLETVRDGQPFERSWPPGGPWR